MIAITNERATTMKKCSVCLSLVILILGACSASQIKPAPALLLETKRIIVVPVGVSAPAGGQIDGWVMFGSALPPEEEGGHALISDALSLFAKEMEHEKLPAKKKTSSEAARKTWNPALTLAQEAATLISSASPFEVSVREEQHTLPSSGRSDSRSLLQDWFRRNTAALNLEELEQMSNTRVLELGLSDYALLDDQLLLQLLVKIVDPSTGQVTARAGNQALIDIGSPEQFFTHGGRKFKTVIVAEGRRLLERNLRDLGLLPGRDAMIH
jgi:hypothetical protein